VGFATHFSNSSGYYSTLIGSAGISILLLLVTGILGFYVINWGSNPLDLAVFVVKADLPVYPPI
jgi:hypothetical protein